MSRKFKPNPTIPSFNERELQGMHEAARKNEEMLLPLNETESKVMSTVAETGNAARLKQTPQTHFKQTHFKQTESLVNSSGAHFRPLYTWLPIDRVLLMENLHDENPTENEHPVGDGAT